MKIIECKEPTRYAPIEAPSGADDAAIIAAMRGKHPVRKVSIHEPGGGWIDLDLFSVRLWSQLSTQTGDLTGDLEIAGYGKAPAFVEQGSVIRLLVPGEWLIAGSSINVFGQIVGWHHREANGPNREYWSATFRLLQEKDLPR